MCKHLLHHWKSEVLSVGGGRGVGVTSPWREGGGLKLLGWIPFSPECHGQDGARVAGVSPSALALVNSANGAFEIEKILLTHSLARPHSGPPTPHTDDGGGL